MSGKRRNIQHSMQGVFVFVLLGLFAVMSTLMVLLGAQMYRNTVDHATANNEGRILGAYVRSMIRAQDAADMVVIQDLGGVKALGLRDILDDEEYCTWLYCYEGSLYEQFTDRTEDDLEPQGGTAICQAQSFEPELGGDGLLTVRMVDGKGEPCVVQVALRCAQ